MRSIKYLCFVTLFALLLINPAQAIEHMVGYQGKVTDTDGIGITGVYDIHFRLYDAASGGVLVDSATVASVSIEKGLFSVDIPFDLDMADLAGDLYLEIWIDGDEMSPRQMITAEMLAFRAHLSDSTSAVAWADIVGVPAHLSGSLQDAYDGGNTIAIGSAGEVEIDAPESATGAGDGGRALDVTGNDDIGEVFRAYNAGDGPAIFSSGHFRINGAKKFFSTTDLKFQLDKDGSSSTNNSFQVRDDADVTVFKVDETGQVETARLMLSDVLDDLTPTQVLTLDGSGNVLKAPMPSGSGVFDPDTIMGVDHDTIVVMNDLKVHGELIADSIQAVGDTLFIDDITSINGNLRAGCAQFDSEVPVYDEFLDEGFEDILFPPAGWTQSYVDGTLDWEQSTEPHSGTYSAEFSGSGDGYATELITPSMNISGYSEGEVLLEFYHKQEVWYTDQDSLAIHYSTDGGSSWSYLTSWSESIDDYTLESLVLPEPSADYMVKFYAYEDWGYGVFIDDVYIAALSGYSTAEVRICEGNVVADNEISGAAFTLDGETITEWPIIPGPFRPDTLQGIVHDTIVVNGDMKVVGELIADSIQAVGDIVTIDDDLGVEGCITSRSTSLSEIYTESFDGGTTPTDWSIEDLTGSAAITFETVSFHPSGVSPSDGTHLVRFNSYTCTSGNVGQLEQTASIATTGYSDVILNFDIYHDTGYSNLDRVTVRYSHDGLAWTDIQTYDRYNGTTGWETITLPLPEACIDVPALYLAYLFTSAYGNDVHIDNMVVSAGSIASIELCGGDIEATGDVSAGSFTLGGATITAWPGGSGGTVSLQDAYDGGNTIAIGSAGEVDIDAPESAPDAGDGGRALDVTGNDDTGDVFRAYNAGDGPAIFSSGHLRINGAKKFYSTTDLKFQLDNGGSSSTTNEFQIRDDADVQVFTVDETGVVDLPLAPHGNNARTDWEAENIITVAPANADFTDLAAAITYANAHTPMTIVVSPGSYRIPDASVDADVVIMGSGMTNTQVIGIDDAGLIIREDAEVHDIDLALDVISEGFLAQCALTGPTFTMSAGTITDCNVSAPLNAASETGVIIEGCRLADANIAGSASISDCIIIAESGLGIGGVGAVHMTGCEVYGTVSITGADMTIYAEGNIFTLGGVTLSEATGEFKSNHFVECVTGLVALAPGDLTLIANDFIGCIANGISLDMIDSVTIMDNRIDGQGRSATGINVNTVFGGMTIKGNVITSCNIGINMLPITMPGNVLITHNTLISNATNDLVTGSSCVVSYNTLDSYVNGGMGVSVPGCLNQNSTGTLWTGATQLGQLP